MPWSDEVAALIRVQDGVVARWQLLATGLGETDVRRLIRRRELSVLHPGAYLAHTGDPTWVQRAWAACLVAWPAALSGDSALRADDGPGRRDRIDHDPLSIAVDRDRTVRVPPGSTLHRIPDFEHRARMNLSPPRLRVEEAVLDLASAARDEFAAVQQLAAVVQSRRTTPERLLAALRGRRRIARRAFLRDVLSDIDEGTCSVLEHGFLTRVERPHRLPVGQRQRDGGARRPSYCDVSYVGHGLRVELDGRLFHDNASARDADLERDLDAVIDAEDLTVRLGWGQVFHRACGTAAKVAFLLQRAGWAGTLTRCPECAEGDADSPLRGESQSPGDSDSPQSA